MGSLSLAHWLVVLCVILIVFGAGRLPRVMGDFANGIKNFKANLSDEKVVEEPARIATKDRTPG